RQCARVLHRGALPLKKKRWPYQSRNSSRVVGSQALNGALTARDRVIENDRRLTLGVGLPPEIDVCDVRIQMGEGVHPLGENEEDVTGAKFHFVPAKRLDVKLHVFGIDV